MRKRKLMLMILPFLCFGFITYVYPADMVVMTTSDYISGNTSAYDISQRSFADGVLTHYQDSTVRSYGRYVYILEGGDNSNIIKLDMDDLKTPVYQYSVDPGSNPHDIVFMYSAPITKGYILRYNAQSIWVVNLTAKSESDFKMSEIDISQWADSDGSPDAHIGFIYEGFIYVVLQRYDMGAQAAGISYLIKIDPSTDTLVDMLPDTPEIDGIPLIIKNPQKGSLLDGVIYLGGTTYTGNDGGVMTIDVRDSLYPQRLLFDESTVGGFVQGVNVFTSDFGIVYYYDSNWNTIVNTFSPEKATFGTKVPVPDAGGGAVMINDLLYIGSRDYSAPGLYILNPYVDSESQVVDFYATSLPPYSIAHVDGYEPRSAVEETKPYTFDLKAPYPNPFNPTTTIDFTLSEKSQIKLDIYNSVGQKVDNIAGGILAAGTYSYKWNAEKFSSGLYFVRISNGMVSKSSKIMLLK